MRAAASGDAAATAKLVRLVAPRVAAVVRAIFGPFRSEAEAEDTTQEALVAFTLALPAFRGDCEPASYASRIATRVAIAARRRMRVRSQRDSVDLDETVVSDEHTPHEVAVSTRRMELLRGLLAELPEEQAEALALRVVLGLSLEEVSKLSGSPVNTIRSRVRLAKEALKRRIDLDPRLSSELGLS